MDSLIRNVYCVGRNYRLHAAELGNEVPSEPMIFMKPSHAVIPLNQEVVLPTGRGEIHYEVELVLRVARSYVPGISVDELIDEMAFGIDMTLRDVQTELKKKGSPWTAAKGFRNSAPLSKYIAFPGLEEIVNSDFTLIHNGAEVQRGNVKDMIFSLQQIVDYVAEQYGLGEGDLIFTGTPAGVGSVQDGDNLEITWNGESLGSGKINLDASGIA